MVVESKVIEGFITRAYETARSHGFHDVERSDEHFLMLVLSEIGEMVEADRKNKHADMEKFNEVMSHRDSSNEITRQHYFETLIKDTLEDELADVVIRLCDFCGKRNLVPLMPSGEVLGMSGEFDGIFGKMSVCEQCFSLSCLVSDISRQAHGYKHMKEHYLGMILSFCFEFADFHGIDLVWHVEQKMHYNETRPMKHGKGY